MSESRSENAEKIIRNHMIWSMGAGILPVPLADFFAVSAVQLDMVRQLSNLYNVDFSENESKAIISALMSSVIAKLGARAAVKMIPVIGSVVGGVTMAVISGGSTYAVGETFKKHFESGGTVLDFDIDQLKKVFDSKFEKGKKYAQEVRTEKSTDNVNIVEDVFIDENPSDTDIITQLKEIAGLKSSGLITDEEYETLKKKLINGEEKES